MMYDYEQHLVVRTPRACPWEQSVDSRCFNIPKEEVTNLIYWRQLDAMRNSVQMLGRANFSTRELYGKSCEDIKSMLLNVKGLKWDDLSADKKWGSCCIRNSIGYWEIDTNIPVFRGEDREYIERLIRYEE